MDWVQALQTQPYSRIQLLSAGNATAKWTTEQAQIGRYSVKLYVRNGSHSLAGISIPIDIAIENITELRFSQFIKSYSRGWDIRVAFGLDSALSSELGSDRSVGTLRNNSLIDNSGLLGPNPSTGTWIQVDHIQSSSVQWYAHNTTGTDSITSFHGNWTQLLTWFSSSENSSRNVKKLRVKTLMLTIGGSHSYQNETVFVDLITMNGITLMDEPLRTVNIDIKPGSYPNIINPKEQGLLPVAVLGSRSFSTSEVNIATIKLEDVAPANTGSSNSSKLTYSYEDVNSDGYKDLIVFFRVQDLIESGRLTHATTQLTLTANLENEEPIQGTDTVKVAV